MLVKRTAFISYHHHNDQYYCDLFRDTFASEFNGILTDNSLQRALNSDNAIYIDRIVRENYIHGSSLTIILCGADTDLRKFVDWEISDTLLYDHALLGIILPSCQWETSMNGVRHRLPMRLRDNVESGYANLIGWTYDHQTMRNAIEDAMGRKRASTKRNDRQLMRINGYRR